MGFGDAVRTCLSKCFTWQGRACRSEFWWFQLFLVLAMVVFFAISGVLHAILGNGSIIASLLILPVVLVLLWFDIAALGATVRRLHDTNRSGWWYWISLVPLIGSILLLVWFCTQGTAGGNDYGADPLGGDLAGTFS